MTLGSTSLTPNKKAFSQPFEEAQLSQTSMSTSEICRRSEIAGIGFGVVSCQQIKTGSLIMSEKPLVTVPANFSQRSFLTQLQRLDREGRESFFALRNTFTKFQPIEGIVKTNAIPLGKGSATGAIFPNCSRFNHSCTANAAYHWNEDAGEEKVFAVKDIDLGDEITVTYVPDEVWTLPSKERKEQIARMFGFDCLCTRCACEDQMERTKSDKRRTRIAEIDKNVGDGVLIMTNPSKALLLCREALSLLQEEEESTPRFEVVLYDAFQICVAHGDLARASRFAELAAEAKEAWQGNDATGLAEMRAYIRRPQSHRLASQTQRWRTKAVGLTKPAYLTSSDWLWRRAG